MSFVAGWLGAVVAGLAILSGLGAAATFIVVGRQKGRVLALEAQADLLRDDVADRDKRITYLEGERSRADLLSSAQAAEIVGLHREMETLGRVITGEANFAALHDQIDAQFANVMNGQLAILNTQRDILRLLGDQRAGGTT